MADKDADLGLGGFAERPINRHALADVRNQFPRDVFQRRFAENFYGAVVHFQRVIESNLVMTQAQVLGNASRMYLAIPSMKSY
jgi:hypothetical protein